MITNTNDDPITRTCLYPLYPQFDCAAVGSLVIRDPFDELNALREEIKSIREENSRLRQQLENLNDNKRN